MYLWEEIYYNIIKAVYDKCTDSIILSGKTINAFYNTVVLGSAVRQKRKAIKFKKGRNKIGRRHDNVFRMLCTHTKLQKILEWISTSGKIANYKNNIFKSQFNVYISTKKKKVFKLL